MQQIRIFISGDVQGVGFRQFVRSKARTLGLTGWTRNLSDGRVEVVVQGEQGKIDELIDWCKKGPILSAVHDVDIYSERIEAVIEDFRVYPTV